MVPVLKGHHTVFFKYGPLVNTKYPNRCPKQFETACEGFSVSSGRDGGRAELCLFIYLFPAGGATQRVCLFRLNKHVPKSPPWDAEESTHRGGGELPAADGHLWLSS